MMSQRKYIKGDRLSLYEAVQHITEGRYIFERNKPQHPGWAAGWPLSLLRGFCAQGVIFEAKLNPDYKERTMQQDAGEVV